MHKVKMALVDGTKFYTLILLGPDRIVNGVPIYYFDEEAINFFGRELKRLGLKKGEFAYTRGGYEFTFPKYWIRYKIGKVANKFYWTIIKWLYLNACMFRRKLPGEIFSWSSFTPYCWYRSIRTSLLAKRGQRQQALRDRNRRRR